MRFKFDKAACQNTRRALGKEWLLTNGLGDYASSSILYCNTRKYHGLLVASTPDGRAVLLSTMEESVVGGGKEFFISARQHPGQLYPQGHQYQESFTLDPWPVFTYRIGDVRITREALLLKGVTRLLLRWKIQGPTQGGRTFPEMTLRLKPLLAYRGFHQLTFANDAIHPKAWVSPGGFGISPYDGMPSIYFQTTRAHSFMPRPDWYTKIEYFQERERGFDFSEDLFQPGILDIPFPPLPQGGTIYLAVGTEELAEVGENLATIWEREETLLKTQQARAVGMIGHLEREGENFCVRNPQGQLEVIAGYHWFDAWGRDTLIALPGLAFYGGRTQFGLEVLAQAPRYMRNGLLPNMFGPHENHSYNCADASLWYAFALQCYLKEEGDTGLGWVREHAWEALKQIVAGYRSGPGMDIFIDGNGLLHAGNPDTQLTWMDAYVNGQPVTPRWGCPVDLQALWYNTLSFVDYLSKKFHEPEWGCHEERMKLRKSFFERFWVAKDGGYLGDVWRDGMLDQSIRPNQILAVSLPNALLEERWRPSVMEVVRKQLLTPYGLRTLAPGDASYRPKYEGGPESRDSSYHQGTVWPFLLGQYTDGILRAKWEAEPAAKKLLDKVEPLFTLHLADAGLGSISEVFDGTPPQRPNGTVAQAWSVAECLRMLITLKRVAPIAYAQWEERVASRLANPTDDTAGVCRVTMNLAGPDGSAS